MRYVISDIHGEYEKLNRLINYLKKDATEYIFLGDYIDKGRRIRETVDFLMELRKSKKCTFLIGDHEYAWLQYLTGNERFLEFVLNYGGIQTLESYLGKELALEKARLILTNKKTAEKILKIHMDFYLNLKFYYEVNAEFICVHAGINPENKDVPLEFHNKEELVFLRNNFINSKFFYNGKKIIFGHTAFKRPYVDVYKIGIDTGAVYPEMGSLTAFNIEKKFFIQHNRRKFTLDGDRK